MEEKRIEIDRIFATAAVMASPCADRNPLTHRRKGGCLGRGVDLLRDIARQYVPRRQSVSPRLMKRCTV